jgi:hypothetical protein
MQTTKLLIMQFSLTLSLLGPNILVSILFSNAFSQYFPFTKRDEVRSQTKPQAKL